MSSRVLFLQNFCNSIKCYVYEIDLHNFFLYYFSIQCANEHNNKRTCIVFAECFRSTDKNMIEKWFLKSVSLIIFIVITTKLTVFLLIFFSYFQTCASALRSYCECLNDGYAIEWINFYGRPDITHYAEYGLIKSPHQSVRVIFSN